jgi:AraC-like DNA-binding protein
VLHSHHFLGAGRFSSLREDARKTAELLRNEPSHHWTLQELAMAMHLSQSQLSRMFIAAFGKTPIAYLTILRTEWMAELLRTSDASITRIAKQAGWRDADFAARQFRRGVGVTPSRYRAMGHDR